MAFSTGSFCIEEPCNEASPEVACLPGLDDSADGGDTQHAAKLNLPHQVCRSVDPYPAIEGSYLRFDAEGSQVGDDPAQYRFVGGLQRHPPIARCLAMSF